MPRSKSLCGAFDEQKLMELISSAPEFADSKHELGKKREKEIWERFAGEMDTSVPAVKEKWLELQGGKEKKSKNPEAGKARADRGTRGEDEATETIIGRKSLRSHSVDKEMTAALASPVQELIDSASKREPRSKKEKKEKGGNNSNNDDPPPTKTERRLLRSKSQLSSISESVGTRSPVMETTIVAQEEQDLGTPVIDTCNQENALSNGEKRRSDFARDSEVESTLSLDLEKFISECTPFSVSEKMLRPLLTRIEEKEAADSNDSTRYFFESMAMTVATFPQHIQASIKARVCKLVAEMEYDLSLPQAL